MSTPSVKVWAQNMEISSPMYLPKIAMLQVGPLGVNVFDSQVNGVSNAL